MSFQLFLQSGFYNILLNSQKRQSTCEGNLMHPPPPPRELEKANSDKYLTRYFFFPKNYGFLFWIPNLNFSTIIIPLLRSYYIFSKTWIRLLFVSHTTILPSLRFAVDTGNFNSPLTLPNFVTNFPLSSNT